MTPPAAPEPVVARPPIVAYLSDVEGLWSKLASFTEGNPHVALDARGALSVAPGAVFVFGGDAIDRGPDARRLVAALLALKERQPAQVVLLAGNRDINKMRLVRELDGAPPARMPDELRTRPRGQILKWIFANTMGARDAFERRREELARTPEAPLDDESVAESFLEDLGHGGPLRRYLAACQLAYRSGATMFVHGGVMPENLGVVPGSARRSDDVGEWIARLNTWYDAQIEAFRQGALDEDGAPAWAPLVAYQAPLVGTRLNQASVVYARPTDAAGNPFLPPEEVIGALAASGVRRLVVGHTPTGDTPSILRDERFEFVVADNSYSPVEAGSKLFLRDDELRAEGLTRVEGGAPEEVRCRLTRNELGSPVGKRVASSGHLVKGELSSGDFLLYRSLGNYQVDQRVASARELRASSLVPPRRDE